MPALRLPPCSSLVISALLYLQFHSICNRILMRIKRLKQPKYLFGAIVGALYFYWYFFRTLFAGRHGGHGISIFSSPENLALYQSVGALALLVFLLFAWIIPHQRAALTFTESEVAFLFPAPISRRGLIHFKLLRSQTAILFTTLLLTLVTNRMGGKAWVHALGLWVVLSIINLHMLGSSFARTMLLDRGITNWKRRVAILAVVSLAAGSVFFWARNAIPGFDLSRLQDGESLRDYARQVLTAGPLPYLLYPFRLVVRPYLAQSALGFFAALGPALLLLLAHYWWVVRSDVAFEEASVEASRKVAERVAAVRAGNWRAAQKPLRAKRAPFPLHASGSPAIALLWKNLISAGQAFTFRLWLSLSIFAVIASFGFGQASGTSGLRPVLGLIAAVLMAWSLMLGPQFLRQDFRQDLPLADVLKTYPLRGWQLALGELLAPAAALTGVQWFLLILVVGLFSEPVTSSLGWPAWLGMGFGAAINIPMLNLITLQIPNAATLLFPAWFQAIKGGSAGIEVTGQRLIFVFGQLLVFIIALMPAAALFAVVFFLIRMLAGTAVAIPLASIVAALVLAAEAAGGVVLLGWLFDRFDVAAEQSA